MIYLSDLVNSIIYKILTVLESARPEDSKTVLDIRFGKELNEVFRVKDVV